MKETPTQVCTKIGVCSKSPLLTQMVISALASATAPNDAGCSLCEAVVGFTESFLENNQTEMQIEANLDSLCDVLGSLSVECENLVDAYLPAIIKYLENNESPAAVCGQIGVCDAVAQLAKQALTPANTAAAVSLSVGGAAPAMCALCKTLVSYVELFLSKGAGEMAIAKQLHALCGLTQGFKMQCDSLVDTYLTQIITWVEAMKTPGDICVLVKMCDQ
jgi:saposin